MLKEILAMFSLQLFGGEGGASGGSGAGGDGASAGEGGNTASVEQSAPADEEARLRALGVPEHVLRERANRRAKSGKAFSKPVVKTTAAAEDNAKQQEAETAVAAPNKDNTPTEGEQEKTADTPKKPSFEELMADPDYNKAMQSVVQSRLKTAKAAEEQLSKLTPAIELLAKKYGMDAANMDYSALAEAIGNDNAFYEDKALEMGVSVDTAKRIAQNERAEVQRKQAEEQSFREKMISEHFAKLEAQSEELKKVFPNFNLRTELQNKAFADMVRPGSLVDLETAYFAVHRNEIQSAAAAQVAKTTAQKISNSVRSGTMPRENGTQSSSPSSISHFNYATASREQREYIRNQMRLAAARGEKVKPSDFMR